MTAFKEFTIPFAGLKEGKHHFNYEIDNSFFEAFNYKEFNNVNIKTVVVLDKNSNSLKLNKRFL
jgi:glutamyl/glutaminyl-tRNA synthetase